MAKTKVNSKHADLIAISKGGSGLGGNYENQIFIDDKLRAVMATNGHILLAKRADYGETKVLARLLQAENGCLEWLDTGLFGPRERELPAFHGIIPTVETLARQKKIRVTIPTWLNSISVREKHARVTLILGDTPILAVGEGYANGVTFDAQYLKYFAGQTVDLYLEGDFKHAMTILPADSSLDTAIWFSLLMPIRPTDGKPAPIYAPN